MFKKTALAAMMGVFFPLFGWSDTTLEPEDQKSLREIEEKVTRLKESVYQTKLRMRDLEEAVLRGKIAGSKALITFDNQADGFFALSTAEFRLDGELVAKVNMDEKKKKRPEKMKVFDGDLPAGDHTLEAKILYQGSDQSIYTLFSYFKDHKFDLSAVEKFTVDYGKTAQLKLTALDRGYFKTDLKERLFLEVQSTKDWGAEAPE